MYAILFNIAIGLRVGELEALRWSDVDFEKGTLTVAGQMVLKVEDDEDGNLHPRKKVRYPTIREMRQPG